MVFLRSTLPSIVIGASERHDLTVLTMGGLGHTADAADDLLYELGRAKVVDDHRLPPDVVRMGSTATLRLDCGQVQVVRLAYPGEDGPNDASIFSSLGTALIGLRPGQSIKWTDRGGGTRDFTVLNVRNPKVPHSA